jgi:BioD-like phosphotransacetylase family protein
MTGTKMRYEFSLDSDLAALLNTRAKKQGAAKSDIVIQAVKAFLERRTEDELAHILTKRFDAISHDLGSIRNDLEAARGDHRQMKSDMAKVLENLSEISALLNARLPTPSCDKQPSRRVHFFNSIGRIVRNIVFYEPENERRNP